MTALLGRAFPRRIGHPRVGAAIGAFLAGAGLLLAGCASGSTSSGTSSAAGAPAARGAYSAAAPAAPGQAHLADLTPAGGGSIVYTASLTVRAANVRAAATRAAHLASAAGGYVSGEDTMLDRSHPGRSSVRIQLKIPAASYPAALAQLSSGLGTMVSMSRQARDVTQTVADVSSRVASAHAAIAQLRKLLARAGSVSALLGVQDQINQQEASLEALLSQQRALAHETAYATVSVLLVATPSAAAHHRRPPAQGFTNGLAAGWRAFRVVLTALATAAGAVLPFGLILAAVALLGYGGWRWLARRRAGARPAG